MKRIERGTTLKGRQVFRKNRNREHRGKKITESDIMSLAKMQSASGIKKALSTLDGLEKNDARNVEEENER